MISAELPLNKTLKTLNLSISILTKQVITIFIVKGRMHWVKC